MKTFGVVVGLVLIAVAGIAEARCIGYDSTGFVAQGPWGDSVNGSGWHWKTYGPYSTGGSTGMGSGQTEARAA